MTVRTYTLCDVVVSLEGLASPHLAEVETLWRQLFAISSKNGLPAAPAVTLMFKSDLSFLARSRPGNEIFRLANLQVWKTQPGFRLQCGHSVLDLDLSESRGQCYLHEGFWDTPWPIQRSFFLLGLLMLLLRHGLYNLHANGVISDGGGEDDGCLIIGDSGRGKTTLTLGLVHAGWDYVSDDALMLRDSAHAVEALAFRRGFSCTYETLVRMPGLAVANLETASQVEGKQPVDLDVVYPNRFSNRCIPRLLLFPQVAGGMRSRLIPMAETQALTSLMRQSPGLMVDRPIVAKQMAALTRLVQQAPSYQLLLGEDVYEDLGAVTELLQAVQRGQVCPPS